MDTTIRTLRIITAVTLRRILTPVLGVTGVAFLVSYVCTTLLVSQVSGWWLLLLILLIPLTLVFALIGTGLWLVSGKLLPSNYQKAYKKDVVAFTDKMMRLIESSKTPYPIHLLLIGKDVVRGKESSHLKEIINDSKTLKRDFDELRKKF